MNEYDEINNIKKEDFNNSSSSNEDINNIND